jgi:hypothetical protein
MGGGKDTVRDHSLLACVGLMTDPACVFREVYRRMAATEAPSEARTTGFPRVALQRCACPDTLSRPGLRESDAPVQIGEEDDAA